MSANYGTHRVVPGAHYGTRDWLAQRVTAVLMTLFTLIGGGCFLLGSLLMWPECMPGTRRKGT